MKNFRFLVFVAIAAIIGFTLAACGDNDDPSDTTHVHTLSKISAKAAACETAGNPDYWTCSDCGKFYADADGTTELTAAQIVIAALGHDVDNVTDWEVTTPPSILAAGEEEGTCPVCSETATRPIPKLTPLVDMVRISAGTFTIGSPEEEPGRFSNETQHTVTLTKDFFMGRYPVTQAQYKEVMGENPSYFKGDNLPAELTNENNLPVETVSWFDAIVFCNKLSMKEGLTPAYKIDGETDPAEWGDVPTSTTHENYATWNGAEVVANSTGYRLPTEAQWEYACRAGTTKAFNWDLDTINDTQANYYASYVDANNTEAGTDLNSTSEVGDYEANAWGLYDMHGNVFEWCWDRYGVFDDEAQTDPTGAVSGAYRVGRGGAWGNYGQGARSACRSYDGPDYRYGLIGFRLVRP